MAQHSLLSRWVRPDGVDTMLVCVPEIALVGELAPWIEAELSVTYIEHWCRGEASPEDGVAWRTRFSLQEPGAQIVRIKPT